MSVLTEDLLTHARSRLEDLDRLRAAGLIVKNADFYPSGVHYPPITKYTPISEDEMFAGYTMPEDGRLDVYAHIPFCRQRCTFCHYPLKLGPKMVEEKDRYLAAMEIEMDLYLRRLGLDRITPRSILVGGGTPTFLTPEQLKRFLVSFDKRVDLHASTQFSYDVDPNNFLGDEGLERMRIMRDHGVHRVTIGIQSFNPTVLRLMNRHHGRDEALRSIELSLAAGFEVNIEFIFGYPGQDLENWAEGIEEACNLGVTEIQLYRLKIDAYGDYQGPIKQYLDKYPDRVVSNETAIMMKQVAHDILNKHGYHENVLRRVFSKGPQHYSHYAHNQCCRLIDQIGIGLTAFSSLRNRFVLNTDDFNDYYARIERGELPCNRGLVRGLEEQMRWAMILPLKNRTVRRLEFEARTGLKLEQAWPEKIARLKAEGLIEDTRWGISLTTTGKFFADEVVQQFFDPKELPFPADAYADGPLHPLRDTDMFGAGSAAPWRVAAE
jgi:oxygen-independent coproporphyrinogen III oxidase